MELIYKYAVGLSVLKNHGGAVALRNTTTRYGIIFGYKILYLVCLLLNVTAPSFLLFDVSHPLILLKKQL